MVLIEADPQAGTARVNMQAPGTGLLSNQRTLWVFLASNITFGMLALWIFRIRATILQVSARLHTTEAL
jgi:heme exporter protein C